MSTIHERVVACSCAKNLYADVPFLLAEALVRILRLS